MSSTTWTDWSPVGELQPSELVLVRAHLGAMYAMAISGGKIYVARQSGEHPGEWSAWTSTGLASAKQLTAVFCPDGRVRGFFRNSSNNTLVYLYESSPGGGVFTAPRTLGGRSGAELVAALRADGSILVVDVNTSQRVFAAILGPDNWHDFQEWMTSVAIGYTPDGKVQIFGIGQNATLRVCTQTGTESHEWTAWQDLGGQLRKIAVASEGPRTHVYGIDVQDSLVSLTNDGPRLSWGPWRHHGGKLVNLDVTIGVDGQPIVVAIDAAKRVWSFEPGSISPNMAKVMQGQAMRMTVTGLGLDRVRDIELRLRGGDFASIYAAITIRETAPELLRFDLPPELTRAFEPGRFEYDLRVTDEAQRLSAAIDGAVHVRPDPSAPLASAVVFESSSSPGTCTQGEPLTMRIQGAYLAGTLDVLVEQDSLFAGQDPRDPSSDVHFVEPLDDREIVITLGPAWTGAHAPGALHLMLTVVGAQGHSPPIYANLEILESASTPKITGVATLLAGAEPPPTNVWTQGAEVVMTIEGQGLASPRDVVFPGTSVQDEPALEILVDESTDTALRIAMGAAYTRTLGPGAQSLTITVIGAQGHRSAPGSVTVQVDADPDATPRIDSISIVPAGGGAVDTWTQSDALLCTIVGVNLRNATDVIDETGDSWLDEHTVILAEQSDDVTLVLALDSEATSGHTPGPMTLVLSVAGEHGHHSNAHALNAYVCLHPDTPRLRSVTEAQVSADG